MFDKEVITKNITEFSLSPGPRYRRTGEDSAEEFYEEYLSKWMTDAKDDDKKLRIVLDGTSGFLSSFLDESFNRLIKDFEVDYLKKNIEIVSDEEPQWRDMIYTMFKDAR